MSNAKIGPTGEYPQGRYIAGDRGGLNAALRVDVPNQRIIMIFGTEINWLAMTAEDAEVFGNGLLAAAKKLKSQNGIKNSDDSGT